jgi:toxin-antitoxin system PIN domain toxin
MKLLDVNIVLAAHREDHPDYPVASRWLAGLVNGGERFGVPWLVWWSFLRLATNRRIFPVPTPIDDALAFITAVRAQPQHIGVEAGIRHLDVLTETCAQGQASGDLLPDAALAALAFENGCEVVSFDRDFARFPGLRWITPAD